MPRTPPTNGAAVRYLTNAQIAHQKTSPAAHAAKQDTFETYAGYPLANPHTPESLMTSHEKFQMFF